jgi:hypothetical protein
MNIDIRPVVNGPFTTTFQKGTHFRVITGSGPSAEAALLDLHEQAKRLAQQRCDDLTARFDRGDGYRDNRESWHLDVTCSTEAARLAYGDSAWLAYGTFVETDDPQFGYARIDNTTGERWSRPR